MADLRLSLKRQWFEMTKAGIKPEDYRELNDYWFNRIVNHKSSVITIEQCVRFVKNLNYYGYKDVDSMFKFHGLYFKPFTTTTLTLGYPSATDTDRIIQFEHAGIEIRTGNPELGAEPGKLYFVIKHGKRIS